MTHGKNTLRIMLTGAVCAFAVMAPVAEAKQVQAPADVHVCNQATANSLGGSYDATDGDSGPAARHTEGLKGHPGQGAGLYTAAAHSRALSECSEPDDGGSGPWDPNSSFDS